MRVSIDLGNTYPGVRNIGDRKKEQVLLKE